MSPLSALRGLLCLAAPLLVVHLTYRTLPVAAHWEQLLGITREVLRPGPGGPDRETLRPRLEALASSTRPSQLALTLKLPLEIGGPDPQWFEAALEALTRTGTSPLARSLGRYREGPGAPTLGKEISEASSLARLFEGWRLAHRPDPAPLGQLVASLPPPGRAGFHELYLHLIHRVRTAPRDLETARDLLDRLRHQVSRPPEQRHLGFGPDPFVPCVRAEADGSLTLDAGPWLGAVVPMRESQLRRRADVVLGLASVYSAMGQAHRSLFQAEILERNHLPEIRQRGLEEVLDRLLHPRAFRSQVRAAARRYRLDPYLLYAVAREESKFQVSAGSPVGAKGLMQVMPDTAAWILRERGEPGKPSDRELTDPATNLDLGAWYLRHLGDKFYSPETRWPWTLAAYNGGLRHATRWLKEFKKRRRKEPGLRPRDVIDFPETRGYVEKVLASRDRYRELYQDPEG